MKICILGAGALGSAIGGVLTEGGHEVWLVNRGAAHVQAMQKHGLKMNENGTDRYVQVHAATNCSEIDLKTGPIDLIIVLVKSFHTREAIESASPIISKDTLVLSLQNGLGHEDVLADVIGRSNVLAGKTYAGGVMLDPGYIIVGTKGKETIIGEIDGQSTKRAKKIAKVFNDAGLVTTVSQNIMCTIWEKLLINVATGALSAITKLPYGDLYQIPEIEQTAIEAVAEAMLVARAAGVELMTKNPRDAWIKASVGLPYEFKASMLQSIEKGSVTEIDYVNGSVVACGKKYGIPTPVNSALVACVKGVECHMLKKIN